MQARLKGCVANGLPIRRRGRALLPFLAILGIAFSLRSLLRTHRTLYADPTPAAHAAEALLPTKLRWDNTSSPSASRSSRIETEEASAAAVVSAQLRAVIHVGPAKTGTTTIQEASGKLTAELRVDGWEMPWVDVAAAEEGHNDDAAEQEPFFRDGTLKSGENQVNFARCFAPKLPFEKATYEVYESPRDRAKRERDAEPGTPPKRLPVPWYFCKRPLLQSALNISARGHNLLLTSEGFGEPEVDIARLKDFLTPHWPRATVVVYYRNLVDWLSSLYFQSNRWHYHSYDLQNPQPRPDLVDFLSNRTALERKVDDSYTLGIAKRYRKYFDNVVVMDMHNNTGDGLISDFFCGAVTGADRACQKARTGQGSTGKTNRQYTFAFEDMIYSAHRRNMIQIEQVGGNRKRTKRGTFFKDLYSKTVEQYTATRESNPLPVRCLSAEERAYLLNRSIDTVREFFPGSSAEKESELKLFFRRLDRFTSTSAPTAGLTKDLLKFCSVDIDAALDQTGWQDFFRTL